MAMLLSTLLMLYQVSCFFRCCDDSLSNNFMAFTNIDRDQVIQDGPLYNIMKSCDVASYIHLIL